MGGSEQGPDTLPVRYSTIHRLEVPVRWDPGGVLPSKSWQAAYERLAAAADDYPWDVRDADVALEVRGPGEGALVLAVGMTLELDRPAAFPAPTRDLTPGQRMDRAGGLGGDGAGPVARPADGMDLGEGFGRAGAG